MNTNLQVLSKQHIVEKKIKQTANLIYEKEQAKNKKSTRQRDEFLECLRQLSQYGLTKHGDGIPSNVAWNIRNEINRLFAANKIVLKLAWTPKPIYILSKSEV